MDIIVFFKTKDSRRIYEKSQRCMPPPPREISKILISSALAVLLSVSAEAGAVTESNNQIIFTSSDNTFTPSNGVYTTTQNKIIQVSKEVATAHFYGGITISGGNTAINMFGSSTPYASQSFEFGSGVGSASMLQVAKNASLDFNFSTLGSAKNQIYNLSAMTSDATSGSIVNQGTMNFNLGENTKLYFKSYANVGSGTTSVSLPISNSGTMNFNFSSNSEIHLDMSTINSTLQNQGVIVFDFSNARNTALDGGVLQNEASPMDASSITFKFKNSWGASFGNNSQIAINNNDIDNKRGIVFSMEGNSLVALSQVALTKVTFDFKGYGNILDLGEGFSSPRILQT